jgi:hypothetical protein
MCSCKPDCPGMSFEYVPGRSWKRVGLRELRGRGQAIQQAVGEYARDVKVFGLGERTWPPLNAKWVPSRNCPPLAVAFLRTSLKLMLQ